MWNIVVTGVASFLTDLSTEMVYPLIPFFLSTIGASPAVLGLIEGFAESSASLLKLVSGHLSDRLGRRKPLAIAGYLLSATGKAGLYFARSWGTVFCSRMIERVGKGFRVAPRDAIIAESSSQGQRNRAFGLHRAMDTLGAAVGVSVAIALVSRFPKNPVRSDFVPIFLIALIPGILGSAVLFLIREQRRSRPARHPVSSGLSVTPTKLRRFLVIIGIFALGNSSDQFLLLRAKTLGFPTITVLTIYLLYNLVYGFLSYPAGSAADRFGRRQLLASGYALYGLVYFGFAFLTPSSPKWLTWLLFGVYGLRSAMTEGLEKALVADISPPQHRGTFLGLHATLVGVSLLPASLLAGTIWTVFGASAPFWFGGVLGIVAALGLAFAL
ncbi:MAG: MFS transporter [candidate division WOR-3 bacterium]